MILNPSDAAAWRVGDEVRHAGLTWIVTRVDASGVTIVAGKGVHDDERVDAPPTN